MKKIIKTILLIVVILALIISAILIYLGRPDSSSKNKSSSSVWLTKVKETVFPAYITNEGNEPSLTSVVSANIDVVNASSWFQSAYNNSSISDFTSNLLSENFCSLSTPVPVNVIQYFDVYLLNYKSSTTIPKTYIVSTAANDLADSIKNLDLKIKQLIETLNNYNTWTYGANQLSYELAGYNLQKYAYPNYNKINTLLYKVNMYRNNNSLNILKTDSKLQLFAMERAVELAWVYDKTGSYSSMNPDGNTPDILSDHGYVFYGENVAYNSFSSNDVFNLWTNLDFARKNLLNDKYNHAGIGLAQAKDGTWFWVIMYTDK